MGEGGTRGGEAEVGTDIEEDRTRGAEAGIEGISIEMTMIGGTVTSIGLEKDRTTDDLDIDQEVMRETDLMIELTNAEECGVSLLITDNEGMILETEMTIAGVEKRFFELIALKHQDVYQYAAPHRKLWRPRSV